MREGTSVYEPYREKITEWCMQGYSVPQMLAELGVGYSKSGLYQYIYKNKLGYSRDNVYESRNHCVGCEFCRKFRNFMGEYDKSNKICTLSWRVISASVVCSPKWCEKGELYGKHLRKL